MKKSCVFAARLNMIADIMSSAPVNPDPSVDQSGHWEFSQDPDSGAITRVWVPGTVDDPDTPTDEAVDWQNVPCEIRGVASGGFRQSGVSQSFGDIYQNIEWLDATFPPDVVITNRDRVTNIRNARGEVVWKNEESTDHPTVYEVMGITPALDPFSNIIEQKVLLKRAEVQV